MKIDTPDNYAKLFERNSDWNMIKFVGGTLGALGVASLCVATWGAAAGPIAATLGKFGLLGAASTGTAISTLHGAALTSASLAAIGGTVAAGTIVISAVGGGIGSGIGLMLSNSYFGELSDFKIKCVYKGNNRLPAIILINGFLQKDSDCDEWIESINLRFPNYPKYYVTWDSKNLNEVYQILSSRGIFEVGKKIAKKQVLEAVNPLDKLLLIKDIIANPWHTAVNNAGKAGCLLAEILARTVSHKAGYIFMGHSLGCRVAYYAAKALATRDNSITDSMYMLSGAIGVNEWESIEKSVKDNIYNFYSPEDNIVGPVYWASFAGMAEDAIGASPISFKSKKINNYDVTPILKKYDYAHSWLHMRYKAAFREILNKYKLPKSSILDFFNFFNFF